jgi:hypothetical protein
MMVRSEREKAAMGGGIAERERPAVAARWAGQCQRKWWRPGAGGSQKLSVDRDGRRERRKAAMRGGMAKRESRDAAAR